MTTNNNNTPDKLNENQFFNIQGRGRTGLNQLVSQYGNEMWAARAGFMDEGGKEKYFKTSIINIANDDRMINFTQDKQGLYQIYKCLSESVQAGLVIGGENPLSEIVEHQKGKLQLNIRAEGYVFLLTKSKNALFKDIKWEIVKDGEKFSINYATNSYEHSYDGSSALGEILGVVIKFIEHDDKVMLKYVNIKDIHASRAKSKSYKTYLEKVEKESWRTNPWETDEPQMCLKTALKIVAKPYAKQLKALSFALSVEEADKYRKQPVKDRMGDRLETLNDNAPEPIIKDITPDDTQRPESEPKSHKNETKTSENEQNTEKNEEKGDKSDKEKTLF